MTILSIMIVVKNDQLGMIKTFESLEGILGSDIELVVQDYKGQSDLRSVFKDNPYITLLESDDQSIADAHDQILSLAKGKYLLFWGAGETAITPQMIKAVKYLDLTKVDILFNCIRIRGTNTICKATPDTIEVYMGCLTPGAMILRDLFLRVCKTFGKQYEVATDYAMFVTLLKETKHYLVSDFTVTDYPLGGLSNASRAYEGFIECELIRMRQYRKSPELTALDIVNISANYLRDKIKP